MYSLNYLSIYLDCTNYISEFLLLSENLFKQHFE